MSRIKIAPNDSGTGIFTIESPNSNTNRTITLPDNAGNFLTTGSAGAIVQFVNASTQTNTTTTSSTYTDTAITASITPTSSSNKIMVHIVANMGLSTSSGNSTAGGLRILRDSTVIETPYDDNGPISHYVGVFGASAGVLISRFNHSMSVVDSPATTSSVTYKAQIATRGGAEGQVNIVGSNETGTSYITLMEIVA